MGDINDLQNKISRWSDETFKGEQRLTPMLKHLEEEVKELIANPLDRLEYADCFILLLDAYRLAGYSGEDLITAGYQKLEINKQREWDEPDEHGVIKHIKGR